MFFDSLEGELMSIKWHYYKMILKYAPGPALEAINHGYVRLVLPMFFDLSSDPHENWNLFGTKLDNGWMLAPIFREVGKYEMSLKKYPNIKPGQESEGYKK